MLILLSYIFILASGLRKHASSLNLSNIHFTSETEISHKFQLGGLEPDKPLIIIPKISPESYRHNQSLSPTVSLTAGNVSCKIDSTWSYCVIPALRSTRVSVDAKCSSAPCSVLLESYQITPVTSISSKMPLQRSNLLEIDRKQVMVTITCNDSTVKQFSSEIVLRTHHPYTYTNKGNKIYLLFNETLKQLIIQATEAGGKCGSYEVVSNPGTIKVNGTEKVVVVNAKKVTVQGEIKEDLQIDIDMMSSDDTSSKLRVSVFADSSPPTLLMSSEIEDIKQTKAFNLIIKKELVMDKRVYIQLDPHNHSLIGSLNPISTPTHIIQLNQVSYFNLTLNQQIHYKLFQTEDNMLVNITSTSLGNLSLTSGNRTVNGSNLLFKCSNKSCEFTITSLSNRTIGFIQLLSSTINTHEIDYLLLNNSLQLRMKEDEIKYLIIKRAAGKELFFVHVSSPNIITYIGGELCPEPSSSCHEYSGSDMTPIAIQTEESTLYVALQALDTSSFQISIQNSSTKYVQLRDATPIKINFKEDTSITFHYTILSISTVYFNLLSTPSMFTMYITNSNQTPDQSSPYKSNSFIRIDKEEIVEKEFSILVKRVGRDLNQKITLIASNSMSIVTIDKGNPYYDNLQVEENKLYLLVLTPDETKVRVSLEITPLSNQYNLSMRLGPRKDYMMHNHTIISSFNSLNLDTETAKICDQSDSEQFCEIFIELLNNGDKEIDTTFTITVDQSIIQLKSGIWQRYEIDSISKVNQFYFIPKNKKNILIELSNMFMNDKLEYLLWNNSLRSINKEDWPFPNTTSKQDNKHGVTVAAKEVESCYPNCVLLLSVLSTLSLPMTNPFLRFAGSFSIMVTDSVLQLKENQRSMITLTANQSQFLVIDLTQHLKEEQSVITITTNRVIGYQSILAKIAGDEYSPPSTSDHQYNLNNKYTQIRMSDVVKAHPEGKQMILIATPTSFALNSQNSDHSIFSIMYTTSSSIIKQLPISMLTSTRLQARSSEVYKIQFWKQYRVKIMRKQGFPFISYSECPQDDMEKCLKNLDKKQMQIVSKVDEIQPTNSSNMMLLKVISKNQEVLVDLLAVSKDLGVRLSEGVVFTDFGQKGEENKYTLIVYRTKQTEIFVTVYEGSPTATLKSQLDSIELKGVQQNNLIIFTIPPSMYKIKSFLFANLQLIIKDQKMNCSYSISYTVNSNIQLLDGLVTAGTIRPGQNITYVYNDRLNDNMTVSMTFKDTEMLNRCKILIIQSGKQNTTLEPHIKHIQSNTPSPTIVFNLEQNYTSYEIMLKNQGEKGDINYNISINYIDMILLPLGYQYPILLKENQTMDMIVEIENQAVVEFKVKKCNSQHLVFSYTQDKDQFKQGSYSNQIEIEQPVHTSKVHVQASTLFIRVFSETGVFLAVRVKVVSAGGETSVKAGNQGLLEYIIKEQHKAEVYFTPVVCHEKCPKPIRYEYVLGAQLKDVEAQTVCQSSFFLATNQTLLKSQPVDPKKSGQPGKLDYSIPITEDMQYLGFRAILPDGEQIPYRIIELSTVWGQIQKHTNRHFLPFSIVTALIFCCCFMGLRFQNRRKGRYEPLPQ